MLVCVLSELLHSGSLCSFCLLVLAQSSQVISLVLFVLLHALLLLSPCVPLLPFCMLLVFCLNFFWLCFLPCSSVLHDSIL
jgi:hypothetical protein